jgi:ankyrin repeat protein
VLKELLLREEISVCGDTPLLLAAKEGGIHIVNMLLKASGTDIWHRNQWSDTALALAAESGHRGCEAIARSGPQGNTGHHM